METSNRNSMGRGQTNQQGFSISVVNVSERPKVESFQG